MNPPRVYTCSPSWTPIPPPSPYHPSGLSQCTSPEHPVSCIKPGLAIHFTHDIIHVSMPFSQIIPPSPSPTLMGKLGSVSCGVPASFSWVLVCTMFCSSYVISGGSMVGLMSTSSKRAYAIPRSAAPRAPAPVAGHCWLVSLQEILRHSKAYLDQSLWGLLVCRRFCLSPPSISAGMGFDSKCDFTPPTILLGLFHCPWMGGIFLWWDPIFSCQHLFSNELQLWRRWVHILLFHHIPSSYFYWSIFKLTALFCFFFFFYCVKSTDP